MDLDWEIYLKQTAQSILQEQTPRKLMEVRSRIYELLTHCIPPDAIFVGLTKVRFSKILSNHVEVEFFLKGSLDLIPSPSPLSENSNYGGESLLEV